MGFVCEFVANPSTEPSLRDRFTNRILRCVSIHLTHLSASCTLSSFSSSAHGLSPVMSCRCALRRTKQFGTECVNSSRRSCIPWQMTQRSGLSSDCCPPFFLPFLPSQLYFIFSLSPAQRGGIQCYRGKDDGALSGQTLPGPGASCGSSGPSPGRQQP